MVSPLGLQLTVTTLWDILIDMGKTAGSWLFKKKQAAGYSGGNKFIRITSLFRSVTLNKYLNLSKS